MATYKIEGVKYNPANWAALDKTERLACARFAAQRERELNTIETNEHTCAGGPFDGAKIELHSMASAPIHVGAWVGQYEAVNTVKGCGAVWVGTDGGKAVNTHGTSAQAKAAPEVTGQGFDQLRDLLADLAEDPADREKTVSMRPVSITWPVGAVDDFGNLMAGEVPTHCNQAIESFSSKGKGAKRVTRYTLTIRPGHGTGFMDDWGNLTKGSTARTHGATFNRAIEQVTHTIGRARYTINATPEAAASLRARILKAKKWFADKCLPAPTPRRTAADQVADVVAGAMAAAAIDAAQESAAAAELAEVAHTQADTVADVVADVAELAEVAEPVAALAADVVAAMGGAPSTGTPGHTGHATPAQRSSGAPSATGGAGGQRLAGKSGRWVATFHSTPAGLPAMVYTGPDGVASAHEFETGAQRMAALQRMAREADTAAAKPAAQPQAQANHTGTAARVAGVQQASTAACTVFGWTVDQVQAWTPAELAQQVDQLEAVNHHTAALALHCLRAGRVDLATECERIEREHLAAGQLTPELAQARQAVAAELKTPTGPHTPHPTGTQAAKPAPVLAADGADCTHPLKTLGQDCTDPLKTLPQLCNLEALTPTELVGVVVAYTGDACNRPGRGAVVAVNEARGTVDVMLEDGRECRAVWLRSMGSKPGDRYGLKPLRHGAEYLAALAAVVATRKAQAAAAQTEAARLRLEERDRLAVEFAHLERNDGHGGGTFAARNIRAELKRAFPGMKFSVKSTYSSVRVEWTDGPTDAQVCEVVGRFDIGQSDHNTDYFYTKATAFSELFGGVQYLNTTRNTSEAFTAQALADWWPKRGESATHPAPTAQDWKKGQGVFSWQTGCDWLRDSFRKHLHNLAAPVPTPATRKAKA